MVDKFAPRFSIIMPAYNISAFITEALESIKKQSFRDFTCVIVDDGSTDDTKAVAQRIIGNDERFQIISQKNGGLSSARNAGFKQAAGEYVLFLDGDDVFEPRLLEVVDKQIVAYGSDVIIYNSDRLNDQTKHLTNVPAIEASLEAVKNGKNFTARDINKQIFNVFYNSVWTKAFRRQFLVDNGLQFDEKLRRIEDLPFTGRALVLAKSISFVDQILLHYRFNTPTSNTATNFKHHLDIVRSVNALYEFLDSSDQLKYFKQSFDNVVLHDAEYYLWWIALYPEGAETFLKIKAMLREYDIARRPRSYFHKKLYYDLKEIISKGNYDDYLRFILKAERDMRQGISDENENLKVNLEETRRILAVRDDEIIRLQGVIEQASIDMKDLLNSKSYRLGRAATSPMRVFVDAKKKYSHQK